MFCFSRFRFLFNVTGACHYQFHSDTPVRREVTVREHMWVEIDQFERPRYNFTRERTMTQEQDFVDWYDDSESNFSIEEMVYSPEVAD